MKKGEKFLRRRWTTLQKKREEKSRNEEKMKLRVNDERKLLQKKEHLNDPSKKMRQSEDTRHLQYERN